MTKHLQYEGPELEALLEHVRTRHGAAATIVSANKARTGGIGGFFSKERFEVIVEVADEPASAGAAASVDTATAEEAADRLSGVGSAVNGIDDDLWSIISDGAKQETSSHDAAAFAAKLSELINEPVAGSRPGPVESDGDASGALTLNTSASAADSSAPDQEPGVVALRSCRIDRWMDGGGTLDELITDFETQICEPPPLPTSGIVAVVGARECAEPLAVMMAEAAGGSSSNVVVMSPNGVDAEPSAGEVIGVVARLRRRSSLSIVVLDLRLGLDGHRWVSMVLAHLSASQVRFVTDASRSPEATAIALQALERTDVLDLVGIESMAQPERFLELDTPIGSLDARTPTPAMWAAAVLASRGRTGATSAGLTAKAG